MKWTTVKSIRNELLKKWDKGILISRLFDEAIEFPYRIPIKSPTSKDMLEKYETVRDWIRSIEEQAARYQGEVEWREISHRQLGKNLIPAGYIFHNRADLLIFIEKKRNYDTFISLSREVLDPYPELREWIVQSPHTLMENEKNLHRLLDVIHWIMNNPDPGIYIRQLSLEGVDTKFIEQNKRFLTGALDRLLPEKSINRDFSGNKNFEKRYGFLSKPEMIRFRYPAGPPPGEFYSDLAVKADEFCLKNPAVSRVFIIENDITALAFPPVPDSLVLFGRGYNFDSIADAHWLHKKKLFYWGDIDTHGFAILSQFRSYFPKTQSIIMDERTLLTHKLQWSVEKSPAKGMPLHLTTTERKLFRNLEQKESGDNIRLEQEFISFDFLNKIIRDLST